MGTSDRENVYLNGPGARVQDRGAAGDALGPDDTRVIDPSDAASLSVSNNFSSSESSGSLSDILGLTRLVNVPEPVGDNASFIAGQKIGPYLIKGLVGKGGMGVVYRAEQQAPVQRTVALKLVQQRLKGSIAEAFFLRERESLALMDHPAIAKVHDAGTLPDGSLFFAMEWIEGATLDDFVSVTKLGLEDFVKLMIQACYGIAHAHQRGLIHRDLKPSNLLVTELDGQPVPKIIDFGIATRQRKRDKSRLKADATVGTRAYMSPEQGSGETDVDLRADIYSLGALMGECLCVIFGVQSKVARERMSHDLRGAFAASLGRYDEVAIDNDLSSFVRAVKAIPAEIREIVVKASAREREHRYDSAIELAEELQRFLDCRPILAMPRTGRYVARKFMRRNWVAVVCGSVAALLLSGALAFTIDARSDLSTQTTAIAQLQQTLTTQSAKLRSQQQYHDLLLAALEGQLGQAAQSTALNSFGRALPQHFSDPSARSWAQRQLIDDAARLQLALDRNALDRAWRSAAPSAEATRP